MTAAFRQLREKAVGIARDFSFEKERFKCRTATIAT